VNVFLANMDDFAAVNEVYAKFFPDPKPVSNFCSSEYSVVVTEHISGPHMCRCEDSTAQH
jgi:enamine deaminase RidA (YjgF/YER057c/UK114 family)